MFVHVVTYLSMLAIILMVAEKIPNGYEPAFSQFSVVVGRLKLGTSLLLHDTRGQMRITRRCRIIA